VSRTFVKGLVPALALGITPVLLDRAGRHGPVPGCRRIAALDALPAALRT
jgi:hypothetical protein